MSERDAARTVGFSCGTLYYYLRKGEEKGE